MQPESNIQEGDRFVRTIPLQDDQGNALYVKITSSQGNIPVRVDAIDIYEFDEDNSKNKLSVQYQIDEDHPECPDLELIDEDETLRIMSTLKARVPEFVKMILAEAAEQDSGGEVPNE